MSDLTLTNNDNFAALAKDMGMLADTDSGKQKSTFARLKVYHSGVEGETVIKGKKKTILAVDPGQYCLELTNGTKVYGQSPVIRLYNQRFMYKKYVQSATGSGSGTYVKTVMATDLKSSLEDNDGGFNCGKPSGWIEDFDSLDDKTKALIKSVKRTRVLFGLVSISNPVNNKGEEVDAIKEVPFIWEIDNRDAFKIMAEPIKEMAVINSILPQHNLVLNTEERTIPTGAKYYLPSVKLEEKVLDLLDGDQTIFNDFNNWIFSYNEYVLKAHKASEKVLDVSADAETPPTKRLSKKDKEVKDKPLKDLVKEELDDREWDDA